MPYIEWILIGGAIIAIVAAIRYVRRILGYGDHGHHGGGHGMTRHNRFFGH
ncbi:hypothetical protein ACFU44_13955 [Nocardia rhizosphaerihabitans]|uniref:hypothetical protein n=1 Tax=Nocardia rhizosphaerihabitans TaxID=1691570 RepID=UPI003670DFE7